MTSELFPQPIAIKTKKENVMTKRSVILVGVLIVMVALGSAAIGVVSSGAATEAANGTYYTFLPLVMKLLAPLAGTDIYMGGVINTNHYSYNATPHIDYAAPIGWTQTNDYSGTDHSIISPPQSCVAKDLRAELIPRNGATLNTGYHLELTIGYVGGTESVNCLIDDPDTTCVSTTQLTIPANSKIYFRLDNTQIMPGGGAIAVPFAWICSP